DRVSRAQARHAAGNDCGARAVCRAGLPRVCAVLSQSAARRRLHVARAHLRLSQAESDAIEARIAHAEARTGAQVVAVIVARANAYPELAWKAFGLGVAIAALFVAALDVVHPDWMSAYAVWWNVIPILGV